MRIRDALLGRALGFGTAPLGNMFRDIPEEEALATVDAAWEAGVRFFDTAPFYGAGLAEIRLGTALSKRPRDQYLISTKVGRLILDEIETPNARDNGEKGDIFKYGRPNKIVVDYSADGTKQSIENSLKRLKTDRIDFVWIHDVAQDFHGDRWIAMFEAARIGAFPVLTKMLEEGVIKGWGLGVNKTEPVEIMLNLSDAHPNGTLLAGRYTLLDHEHALQRLMPLAAKKGVDLVIGGPYSSGILAGGTHFEYGSVPADIAAKVEQIKALCARYHLPIKAAALQFALANPASAAVIPGASKPERIQEDIAAIQVPIPDEFWRDLRIDRLVAPNAPLPGKN